MPEPSGLGIFLSQEILFVTMRKMGKLTLEEIGLCVPTLSLDELKELETEVMQLA